MFVYHMGTPMAGIDSNKTSNVANSDGIFAAVAPQNRSSLVMGLYVGGKGAALPSMSGIAYRFKVAQSAATGGVSVTPTARDPGAKNPASVFVAIIQAPGFNIGGGVLPLFVGGCVSSNTGGGGWQARNTDQCIQLGDLLSSSCELHVVSASPDQFFELNLEIGA